MRTQHIKILDNWLIMVLASFLLIACEEQPPVRSAAVDTESSSAVEVVDYNGQSVYLDRPARTIVALAPHIVENVFSAGAGDLLVGVVSYSDYPAAASSLPVVGGYSIPNYEKIIELNPDLIIAWQSGNSKTAVQRLQELGFTVYIDQSDKLADVAKSITDIGVLTGHEQQADRVAANYLQKLSQLQATYSKRSNISVFYQLWNDPLQSINGQHTISDAIRLCGGSNIFADQTVIAPIINIESVLDRNPDAIIASGASGKRPPWLDQWSQWPSLSAVKNNNLYFINPDHIHRQTIRLLQGIEAICDHLETARKKAKSTP